MPLTTDLKVLCLVIQRSILREKVRSTTRLLHYVAKKSYLRLLVELEKNHMEMIVRVKKKISRGEPWKG